MDNFKIEVINYLTKAYGNHILFDMRENKNIKHTIAYESLDLAFALIELDKKTRFYGTDVPIFHSEIHVIKAIAEHPEINVGGLADILEVTKGSVSEIIKKLERKGLVYKSVDELNLSRFLLHLTDKGNKAHKNHMHYHTVLNKMVENELHNATESELNFLSDFLSTLKNSIESFDENTSK